VIATGGSIVSEPSTYDRLSTCFTALRLKAQPEEHSGQGRGTGDTRPMAGNTEAMDDLRRIPMAVQRCMARRMRPLIPPRAPLNAVSKDLKKAVHA
jgi:XRE family aerobic/anaerobic benzoate catabolism transcriptional regulator